MAKTLRKSTGGGAAVAEKPARRAQEQPAQTKVGWLTTQVTNLRNEVKAAERANKNTENYITAVAPIATRYAMMGENLPDGTRVVMGWKRVAKAIFQPDVTVAALAGSKD